MYELVRLSQDHPCHHFHKMVNKGAENCAEVTILVDPT